MILIHSLVTLLAISGQLATSGFVSGEKVVHAEIKNTHSVQLVRGREITEQDVAEKDLKEFRSGQLQSLANLNLKDKSDEFKQKMEKAWTKGEVKRVFSQAEKVSQENNEKDQQAEQERLEAERVAEEKRLEQEKAEKAKVEANAAKATQSSNSSSGSFGSGTATGGKRFGPNQAREAFEQITADLGVTGSEKQIWEDIITRESGWNVYATNPSSGAYGLPQSLPGEKMASVGGDYLTNPYTQLTWMYNYVRDRYGSFAGVNWYVRGWY